LSRRPLKELRIVNPHDTAPAQKVGNPPPDSTAAIVTVYESTSPAVLTKRIDRDTDGTLRKTAAAQMIAGRATQRHVDSLESFAGLLDGLTPAQAIGYGVAPGRPVARIVTARELGVTPTDERDTIARTRRHFQFVPQPGVMMFDHDGHPDGPLDPETLHKMLIGAVPALAEARMMWRPSASSCIMDDDYAELSGIGGQRLYLLVADASKIPAAGTAIINRLWAAGIGWFAVSRAGSLLDRTLVDGSVWQPERLDFAGPVVLGPGLRRALAPVRYFGTVTAPFDLRRINADGEVVAAAGKIRTRAREAAAPQAREKRIAYIEAEAPTLAANRDIELEAARDILRRATDQHVLMGDFTLTAQDGSEVSVGQLLDNPSLWHGKRFADPLEPDYAGGDRRIAVVNLHSGGKPFIYSHAHGGQRFTLARPVRRVQIARGDRARVVDQVLDAVRAEGELYDFGDGGAIARVVDGTAMAVSREWLLDYLDRSCEFFTVKVSPEGEVKQSPADAPPSITAAILAKAGERRLPRLTAVTTAPVLRADGSVLDDPGFDATSGLLYLAGVTAPRVPRDPTPAQAVEALRRLWLPVREFPFVDDVDRGVMAASLLTACLRASLPTAPGFAFDAPTAGSGKTLLGKVIGILATGESPPVMPPAGERDDEARKRLFAALLDGRRILLWDNVREPLGGAAIDSFLTAPVFADRKLGVSETLSLPNRALFVCTGNNLRLLGDTCRRILVARIDPQMERPYARSFDFDPEQYAQAHRIDLVVAALTIVRGWITAGRPRLGAGRTASFEQWDDLVRQPVLWVSQVAADHDDLPGLADPLDAIERAFAADPETAKLTALLAAWSASFGGRPTPVKEAIRYAENPGTDPTALALAYALDEVAGERGRLNARILGRWIERNVGRRNAGRWIEAGRLRDGNRTWVLRQESRQPTANNPLNGTKPTSQDAGGSNQVGLVAVSGFPAVDGHADSAVEAF
jgi:hypothetical protein